jgi:glycosyltransferase involved in cell wall biosynthesis
LLKQALAGPLARQFDRPVQWFYDPMAAPCFLGKLEESVIVYDCMDQLSQFKFAPPEIRQREHQLLAAADVVFVGGRKLHHEKSRSNPNAHFYGCGVEFKHFSKARSPETVVPFDLDFIHRPILGYFGVIDERLDYQLIEKLAESDPQWSIVMIGPVAKVDPNALPNYVNLYWVGGRPYAQLPAYSKAFNACLMPFALNEATEFINPTKALEYMATGKPIISSAVNDVISNFSDVIKVARTHQEFIELCRVAISSPGEFNIERGLKLAEESGWEAIVAKLENHIRDIFRRHVPEHHLEPQAISSMG